ncbi:pentapeptide repeat-containing protein [Kitasatospora sp. NPDC059747]|uniref:pentapeptide repeat-containing protein n=1 Tax=Kitasatospora sp. NPDC059747 TaxID=3346930 RepID=UPI003657C706
MSQTDSDLVGCRGSQLPGLNICLVHAEAEDRTEYFRSLRASGARAKVDHRGTRLDAALLAGLLGALRNPDTERIEVGRAWFDEAEFSSDAAFDGATFSGEARFTGATFSGDTRFAGATFSGSAGFTGATFSGDTRFNGATFSGDTRFDGATFSGGAVFDGATFSGRTGFVAATFSGGAGFNEATFSADTWFAGATFSGGAGFNGATFSGDTRFDGATFSGSAWFVGATFSADAEFAGAEFSGDADFRRGTFTAARSFGPLVCRHALNLSEAVFELPVTMEIAAREVRCAGTRWESRATLRLRYAVVDLSDAVLSSPTAVTAHPVSFTADGSEVLDELPLLPLDPRAWVASVQGVDVGHLVLTSTNLTECRFTEAIHLDQLRLEGSCTFARTPTGYHWRRHLYKVGLYRWSRRRTLAEEHHWRAQRAEETGIKNPNPPRGWQTPDTAVSAGPEPASLAATYRQLRKAFEDGKDEPGAADFYYGEMEMRRHDRTGTSRAERGLLWAYWLLSGYSLRALRAVGWLAAAIVLTVILLMEFGLPLDPGPTEKSQGTVTAGQVVSWNTTPQEPGGAAPGERFTVPRLEWGTRTALNSVVFRSAGQGLTTSGTYIEMVSRFVEPILLVLALLAVRNRVKR